MNVPQDWLGNKLEAYVELTGRDVENARTREIEKTPYIMLVAGQRRQATTPVKIRMPSTEEFYESYNVENPTLGYCFSPNLQGRYIVEEVINRNEVLNIVIQATLAAKEAYENMLFQVILQIDDADIDKIEEGQIIQREVIYNFPKDFVDRGEIKLVGPRVTAEFKLKKVSPLENP